MAARGTWRYGVQYYTNDIVTLNGRTWRAVANSRNIVPGTNFRIWTLQTSSVDITVTPTTYRPTLYISSPRLPSQRIEGARGEEIQVRRDMSNISSNYVYWGLVQYRNWSDAVDEEIRLGNIPNIWSDDLEADPLFPPDDPYTPSNENAYAKRNFVPTTPEQFERMVFTGVDEDGRIDPNNNYPSFAKNWLLYTDDFVNNGYTNPNTDIAVLDHEFKFLFYCLITDFYHSWRQDDYDENGNVNPNGNIVSPAKRGNVRYYRNFDRWAIYPTNQWVNTWFPIVVRANKRLARMFRKRYGFKKIGIYGHGGYHAWWEGMTDLNNLLPVGKTHRGWMKWTWRRILKKWEDAGMFTESSPGAGDYFDKISCQPKQDKPDRPWSYPRSVEKGFDVIVREMTDAYRPWVSKTILMINPYHSIIGADVRRKSQWDQAYDVGNASYPINVNYRNPDPNKPYTSEGNRVSLNYPLKLNKEVDEILKVYARYANGFDIFDFNFYWLHFPQWATLNDTNKLKYWLNGYDGDFSERDKYSELYENIFKPWYQKLKTTFNTRNT